MSDELAISLIAGVAALREVEVQILNVMRLSNDLGLATLKVEDSMLEKIESERERLIKLSDSTIEATLEQLQALLEAKDKAVTPENTNA